MDKIIPTFDQTIHNFTTRRKYIKSLEQRRTCTTLYKIEQTLQQKTLQTYTKFYTLHTTIQNYTTL